MQAIKELANSLVHSGKLVDLVDNVLVRLYVSYPRNRSLNCKIQLDVCVY